jgi:hypothetical protein
MIMQEMRRANAPRPNRKAGFYPVAFFAFPDTPFVGRFDTG